MIKKTTVNIEKSKFSIEELLLLDTYQVNAYVDLFSNKDLYFRNEITIGNLTSQILFSFPDCVGLFKRVGELLEVYDIFCKELIKQFFKIYNDPNVEKNDKKKIGNFIIFALSDDFRENLAYEVSMNFHIDNLSEMNKLILLYPDSLDSFRVISSALKRNPDLVFSIMEDYCGRPKFNDFYGTIKNACDKAAEFEESVKRIHTEPSSYTNLNRVSPQVVYDVLNRLEYIYSKHLEIQEKHKQQRKASLEAQRF